jgi:hypothetical protein
LPPLERINRVDEMFKASLNRVVIKSNDGNMEKSSGPLIYMVVKRIINEMAMLKINIKSRINGGNGIIMSAMVEMIKTTTRF